jgi:myo-inositol-1(or 4)-monophosphatase
VRAKSTPTDPVTVVDTETERLLRVRLAELRPGEHILGEEEGGSTGGREGLTWVLDPIDGTVNFVYGIETYAVSVAVQRDGASLAGAVANVPTGAVYSAALGHGARVQRAGVTTPLRVRSAVELSMSLIGTGFSYAPEQRTRQAEILTMLLPVVRDVRRMGSCALDLCMVAAGRLDGYYEDGVHVWDWAAGALIAAEAGARLRLPPADGGAGLIVAAAPGIAEALAGALRHSGAL